MSNPKRPTDFNQRALQVVLEAVGEAQKQEAPAESLSLRGRKGGNKGGRARAVSLTPEQRIEIARMAAEARWKKSDET